MTITRRRNTALALVLLIVVTGCSSGDGDSDSDGSQPAGDEQTTGDTDSGSDSSQPPNDGQASGDGEFNTEMDPSFDVASLPDDFPPELLPDSFTAGLYAEIGQARSVSFESSSSFDDVVAEYTNKIGEEPLVVEGEERLATWLIDDAWAVTVFESTPTLVGISTAG